MMDQATEDGASAIRRTVEALWKDVLRREDVRGSDSFFDLGGTSLSAMKLIVAVEKIYGRDAITPEQLYGNPTFGDLVAAVQASAAR